MKKKAAKIISVGLLLFGIGIIYFIGQNMGWNQIWEIISGIRLWELGIILLFPISWNLLHSLGWFFLFDEKRKFNFFHILGAQVSSTAVAEVVPLGQAGGEPYRAYYVKKKYHSDASPNIIASIILYNTIHTIVTGILLAAGFIILLSVINVSFYKQLMFIFALILGFGAVLLFIQKQKKGFMGKIFSFLGRFKVFQKFVEKKQHKAVMVDERLKQFYHHHRGHFYIGLGVILIAKFLGAVEFYLILDFIGYPVPFSIAFLVFAGNAFVQLFLFFFPAQIGASEGSIFYLFSILTLNPVFGISLALFRRIRVIFWTLIGLLVGYLWGPGKTYQNPKYVQ